MKEFIEQYDNKILTHGVHQEQVTKKSSIDIHVEEVTRNGYTLIKNAIHSKDIQNYRKLIEAIYETQAKEIGGEDKLISCRDSDIARCLLAYDEQFLALAYNKKLNAISQELLGTKTVLLMQNGILNKKNKKQHQTHWHRDLNFQHWVCSDVLAINALYCIDDFTIENGCTIALPGSHLHANFPSDEYVNKNQIYLEAKSGDLIIMNSMMFHRAGINNTNNTRRAINNVIGKPFMAQQLDIPSLLNGKYSETPELSDFLGYKWNPEKSVEAWRSKRYIQE